LAYFCAAFTDQAHFQFFIKKINDMERNKQIQIGLLAVIALLLIANLFGGGIQNWFGKSGKAGMEAAAAGISAQEYAASSMTPNTGNIPGTNTTATSAPVGPTTTIQYEKDKFEFGVVNEGEIVKHIFKFKNTGTEPLVISNAKASCGCTVPIWPKEPIPPGGSNEIAVEFNTKGKPGAQSKQVTVTANTNPTETFLTVSGEVRSKEQPVARDGKGEKLATDPVKKAGQ
jgi:hypothetical protein